MPVEGLIPSQVLTNIRRHGIVKTMTDFNGDPSHGDLPIESNDDAVLRMLGGATFGPNARLILPSGTELSGAEAQAFTGAFAGDTGDVSGAENSMMGGDRQEEISADPLSSRHDAWTGDPKTDRQNLVARALRAILRRNDPQ